MRISPEMITIDCADPQALAAWWAEALGVEEVQDYDAFVVLAATPLVLGFQRVPEPRPGKNRVHVDFASPDRPADVERLAKLGATVVGEQSMQGMSWTVLQDPEGNEFCLADAGSH
ncbi:VOC family protein [Streptomyces griseus]|uniref:VOC family protein n=1 Tax=Streptomyces griseus TaxID=1911 RepID=UPI0033CF822A